jgi:hypothetical protein
MAIEREISGVSRKPDKKPDKRSLPLEKDLMTEGEIVGWRLGHEATVAVRKAGYEAYGTSKAPKAELQAEKITEEPKADARTAKTEFLEINARNIRDVIQIAKKGLEEIPKWIKDEKKRIGNLGNLENADVKFELTRVGRLMGIYGAGLNEGALRQEGSRQKYCDKLKTIAGDLTKLYRYQIITSTTKLSEIEEVIRKKITDLEERAEKWDYQ